MNHKKKRFNKKKKRQRKRAILAIRILIVITVFVGVKFIPKRENQNLQMGQVIVNNPIILKKQKIKRR